MIILIISAGGKLIYRLVWHLDRSETHNQLEQTGKQLHHYVIKDTIGIMAMETATAT